MKYPDLYLTHIEDTIVEFDAWFDQNHRAVSVRNGRFPHTHTDAGETLGHDTLDEQVRRRANEELVRYRSHQTAA